MEIVVVGRQFRRGEFGSARLNREVAQVLAAVREDPALNLRTQEIDLRDGTIWQPLPGDTVGVAFSEDNSGIDPLTAKIVLDLTIGTVSGVSSAAVLGFWTEILLPRLRRRLGSKALGEDVTEDVTRPSDRS